MSEKPNRGPEGDGSKKRRRKSPNTEKKGHETAGEAHSKDTYNNLLSISGDFDSIYNQIKWEEKPAGILEKWKEVRLNIQSALSIARGVKGIRRNKRIEKYLKDPESIVDLLKDLSEVARGKVEKEEGKDKKFDTEKHTEPEIGPDDLVHIQKRNAERRRKIEEQKQEEQLQNPVLPNDFQIPVVEKTEAEMRAEKEELDKGLAEKAEIEAKIREKKSRKNQKPLAIEDKVADQPVTEAEEIIDENDSAITASEFTTNPDNFSTVSNNFTYSDSVPELSSKKFTKKSSVTAPQAVSNGLVNGSGKKKGVAKSSVSDFDADLSGIELGALGTQETPTTENKSPAPVAPEPEPVVVPTPTATVGEQKSVEPEKVPEKTEPEVKENTEVKATPDAVASERHAPEREVKKPRKYKNVELNEEKQKKESELQERLANIEGEYKKLEGEYNIEGKHREKIKEANREIFVSEEEKVWIEERAEAEKALSDYRAQYIEFYNRDKEAHKNRPWTQKVKDFFTLKWTKDPEMSEDLKEARKAYDTAKKRYGNAIANLYWNEAKKTHGSEVANLNKNRKAKNTEENRRNTEIQKEVEAKISADLLMNVSAREYENLKLARAESLPAKEKHWARKMLEIYTTSNKHKRLLVTSTIFGLGLTATGVGALAMLGLVGGRAAAIMASSWTSAAVAAKSGERRQRMVGRKHHAKLKEAEENFSILKDESTYENLRNEADKERFREALKAAGLGAAAGALVGGGVRLGSQLEILENARQGISDAVEKATNLVKPDLTEATDKVLRKANIVEVGEMQDYPRPLATESPSKISPYIDDLDKNNIPTRAFENSINEEKFTLGGNRNSESYPWKSNITETPRPKVEAIVNEIRDHKLYGRPRIDSGEMSLLDALKANAEKVGYKPKAGLSGQALERDRDQFITSMLEKRMQSDESVKAIRDAVTHDGNKLVLEIDEQGGWKAHLEQGTGRKIGRYDLDKFQSSTPNVAPTEEPTTPTESKPEPSNESIPATSNPEQILVQKNLPLHQFIVQVSDKYIGKPDWESIKAVAASEFGKKDFNVPEFMRVHMANGGNKEMVRAIRQLITESGVKPLPRESLSGYVDRLMYETLSKTINSKILVSK